MAVVTVGTWTRRAPFPLLTDDVAYLAGACGLARLDAVEWGPAYAAVYCALQRGFRDPFHAFWLKQAVVPLLGGTLMHRLALRFGLGPVLAPLSALWCLLALLSVNGTVEFAFVLGLTACLCAASPAPSRWVEFFVLMALAVLVRAEYLVGIVAALVLLCRRPDTDAARRRGQIAGAAVLVGCLVLFWRPASAETGRSWFAFGQQFAVNYAEAHGLPGDPLSDWRRITSRAFPASASIPEAVVENPQMAAWHLGYNVVVRVPRALARLLLPVPSFVVWPFPGMEILGAMVVAATVLAAGAGAVRSRSADPSSLTPLLALAAVSCVSLVFRPQSRHFLPVLPLLVVLAGAGLLSPPAGAGAARSVLKLFLGCLLLLGLASPWAFWARTPERREASMAEWIRGLRQRAASRPMRLLASWYADRVCALVGPNCRAVSLDAEADHRRSLSDFIDEQEVDAVLVGPDWGGREDVQRDARLRLFLSRPGDFGCTATPASEGFRLVTCTAPLRLTPRPVNAPRRG
jgi:hypothetical protein